MLDDEALFEYAVRNRSRLEAAAYGLLGTWRETNEVVQSACIRLARVDAGTIGEPDRWLLAAVVGDCLDRLRPRHRRREDMRAGWVPDPIVTLDAPDSPAPGGAMRVPTLREFAGLGLFHPVVRAVFVLHLLLEESAASVASLVGRTESEVQGLSKPMRRGSPRSAESANEVPARQREAADSFFRAWQRCDLRELRGTGSLLAKVCLDSGAALGRRAFALYAFFNMARAGEWMAGEGWTSHPVLVNGEAGLLVAHHGRTRFVVGFSFEDAGGIEAVYILGDLERIVQLRLPDLGAAPTQ